MSVWLEILLAITCLVVIRFLAPRFIRTVWKTILSLLVVAVGLVALAVGVFWLDDPRSSGAQR